MARKKTLPSTFISQDDLGYEEDDEITGLCEVTNDDPNQIVISNFDFSNSSNADLQAQDTSSISKKTIDNSINKSNGNISSVQLSDTSSTDNRTTKSVPNGITPPIDGEFFTIKRTYTLRKSTIKMLNHIKALDDDINVYMNTLVDAAIRHYYKHITGESGSAPHH
ncbi:hypothetical protein [Clostridium sp. C8-1-8]|uniref:hypothetical protein n=1 Tax=Clostridium sp. C8-1-8 TaxID=2698831 RepID=UPI001371F9C7|nr:hypothetical protein [Clostridium sp. C8-1-8]